MIETLSDAMKNLSDTLKSAFASLPLVIVILLIAGIVIMLITLLLVHLSVRKAARQGSGDKPPSAGDGDDPIDQLKGLFDFSNRLPPYGGWLSEFLSRRGYIKVNDLSLYFLKSLAFLRNNMDGADYKYRLPWYLVIGAEGSGKTAFVNSINMERPIGNMDFTIPHPNPECEWHIFSRGVMLDIRGDLLMHKKDSIGDDKTWRSLLMLLSRYRSARPLNGIVLTIPATELYGKTALSKEALGDRANYLASKLMASQNALGIRIPIYVVITKTDCIPGFQSICNEIPSANRNDILGWSSPYTLTTAYTPKWVDEAFYSIGNNLNQLRLDILGEGRDNDSRDGVFVFPTEIERVKDPLSIYLNSIFKNDGFNEPIMLRGIYFTGDSGMQEFNAPEDDETSYISLDTENVLGGPFGIGDQLPERDNPKKRTLYFVNDLMGEKVFSEYGLANPLQRRLLTINRGLNVAKISTGVFIFLGTYGLFNTYDKFVEGRNQINPMLAKMNLILRDLNQNKMYNTAQTGYTFDVYARQLIDMMHKLNDINFSSVFVPPSWFSNLHKQLNESLKIAYQQIVIRTIYIDLLLKARDLFHQRPEEKDISQSIGQLLQPLSSNEFMLVKRYIEGLETLLKRVEQFNSLKDAADPSDLNELVMYTFQTQLPPAFIEHYGKFRSFLRDTAFPPINLKPYNLLARETLNFLYQNFLNAIFTVTTPTSLPARLNHFMVQLGEKDKASVDLDWLRRFSLDLAQAKVDLGEPGKTWMDAAVFNPGKDFDALFDKIDNSPLFGREVSQFLVDQSAVGFQNLRMQLQVLNQTLSEYPADPKRSLLDNRGQPIPLSTGVINLERSLTMLFSEPYMAVPTEYSFRQNIPPGKMIYWDAKLIQLAHEMAEKFEDFSSKKATGLPPALNENLMLLARHSLQLNIISLVGRAQNFVDYRTDLNTKNAAEEILRTKVNEMKESAPRFLKLLKILNSGAVSRAYLELRSILVTNNLWLLQQVDYLLQSSVPYTVKDPSFGWWDGKPGASFTAYSAKDGEDLKSYLDVQRQVVMNLAMDFAKPLVLFLSSPLMMEAPGDKAIINKWKRIVDQADAYQGRQPGNTMGLLEDFIAMYMTNCDMKMCIREIKPSDIKRESGDFFLETLRNLRKGLLRRAEVLRRKQSIAQYQDLADIYNRFLHGNFPFVGQGATEETPNADPDEIRDFFNKFQKAGGNAKEILDQVYQLGKGADEAFEFLKTMEHIKEFFQTFVGSNPSSELPTYDLNVEFRTNRAMSKGDDLIVDWMLKPNDIDVIKNHDNSRKGTWIYGQPVEVSFRWPEGESIPADPGEDPDQPNLSVDGRVATFRFSGPWSLFWMLRSHAADKKENKDPNAYTLKFKIPTGNGKTATVYNQITMSTPSPSAKKPGKILKVPEFPAIAPEISEDILAQADKPEIADGLVSPVEKKSRDDDQSEPSDSGNEDNKEDKKSDDKKGDDKKDDKKEDKKPDAKPKA